MNGLIIRETINFIDNSLGSFRLYCDVFLFDPSLELSDSELIELIEYALKEEYPKYSVYSRKSFMRKITNSSEYIFTAIVS